MHVVGHYPSVEAESPMPRLRIPLQKSQNGKVQAARKPNSVLGDHSSRRRITTPLQQPTRKFRPWAFTHPLRLNATGRCAPPPEEKRTDSLPIWSCSVWGLPCRSHCCGRGGLLPHPFTLTPWREPRGGLLSVALAVFEP